MEVAVYSIKGSETGRKVTLPASIFGLETPNDHAIYEDVRQILANRRQGTHKSKERGEVSGSTKKPFRQKGTGGARGGHKRSPLWRHGGRVFGPRPRNYGFKLNAKLKVLARASALTYKARESKVTVVENFSFEKPRTKEFLSILKSLKLNDNKVLMILPESNQAVYLSGRNLPNAQVLRADDLNTYDILNADSLIILEGAVGKIEQNLAK